MKTAKHTPKQTSNTVLFYVIAVLIPILFVLLLEGGLRLVGFGKHNPLFIANPANENYLLATPNIMDRYFPFSANKPQVTLETDFFLATKPHNEIRIFVQGGSTAAGFPYGLGASLAGMLEHRLRNSLPNNRVEVVNTAMSAVNSFTLLDLADEIIAQEPDMILIYAGHNEFLGILGASSNFSTSNSFWFTRTMLALKDYRIYQLFQWLYVTLTEKPTATIDPKSTETVASDIRTTMMAKVANEQSIPLNSPVYRAGLAQFESNMATLLAKYQAAGIPVFISTIASNQKDQKPLKSLAIEPEFKTLLAQLSTASTPKNAISNAELQAYSTKFMRSNSALLHYEFASILEGLHAIELAALHYELAIQHDLLKFRAPDAINQSIIALAKEYKATLVDAQQALKMRSANGIIGNNLMLEHLHPNLQGYFVIANAFYETIANSKALPNFIKTSTNSAWQKRLVLPSEEYFGYATIQHLKSNYPFVEAHKKLVLSPPSNTTQELGLAYFNKRIDWTQMMQQNLEYYMRSNNTFMINKTLQILADAMPHNGIHNLRVAEYMRKQNNIPLARHYFHRAKLAGVVQPNIDAILTELE